MTGFGQDKIQQVRKAQFNFSFSSLVGVNIRSNLQPPCNVRDQWRALESRCVLAGGRPPTDAPDHCSGARLDSSDWAVGRGEIEWEGLSFTPVSPLSSIYYWEAWKITSTNLTTHLLLMNLLRQFTWLFCWFFLTWKWRVNLTLRLKSHETLNEQLFYI